MIKSKKQMFIVIGVFILVLMLGTVTYAFFNYTRTGSANNIKTGRIYFNSEQDGSLQLTNVFPVKITDVNPNNLDSVTVAITGDTTYTDGEEFEITLTSVNDTFNGKKIPINYIATYTANTDAVIGTSSSDYWNARNNKEASIYTLTATGKVEERKQILVGYIDNGETGINGTLTIKAYIDADRIAITDTPEENSEWQQGRTVLTTTEWNSFKNSETPISFKIKAESNEGIWVEEPSTPASCFAISPPTMSYIRNPNLNINTCVSKFTEMGFNEYLQEGETLEAYCNGTGTIQGTILQQGLDGGLPESMLTELENAGIILSTGNYIAIIRGYDTSCGSDVVIPKKINATMYTRNPNMNLNTCVSKFTEMKYNENLQEGETLEAYCNGTGTVQGETLQQLLDEGYLYQSELVELENAGIIIAGDTVQANVTTIGEDAFRDSQLTSVTIQNSVTLIGAGAFQDNQLTNVTIPNSVTTIGYSAFADNQLTSVTIPDSVTTIMSEAFRNNQLTNVTIPNSVTTIMIEAFQNNQLTNVTIPNSVTSIGGGAFRENNITSLNIDMTNIPNDFSSEQGISSLTNLTIGNHVNSIGNSAFYGNQLTSVVVPNSVLDAPWNSENRCSYFDIDVKVTWNGETRVCISKAI